MIIQQRKVSEHGQNKTHKKHDENIIEVLERIWHFFFMTVKSKKKKKEQFYLTKLLYKNDEGHRHYFTKFRKKARQCRS